MIKGSASQAADARALNLSISRGSDMQRILNARGGICRPFFMVRNTVHKVLAALCFYVSSKKLKFFSQNYQRHCPFLTDSEKSCIF